MALIKLSYMELDNIIKTFKNSNKILDKISVDTANRKIKFIDFFDIPFDGFFGDFIKDQIKKNVNPILRNKANMRIENLYVGNEISINVEICK